MSQEYTLMHDIVSDHSKRMQNLKRYYPFFRLQENTLQQYRDGRFASLDMGYIALAVLRFFIEENHFNEQDVTYEMYDRFIKAFLHREYALELDPEELDELTQYIFDKMCNDGRPFVFNYYDPETKEDVQARVKLIDSRFAENNLVYFVTGDAIEFYLDTKEVKDESKITAEQILLEKMIKQKNFKGGLDVIRRINSEVGRLKVWKDDVVQVLHSNIFEGIKALEEFNKTGLAWFEDEQKMFASNRALVDSAILKAEKEKATSSEGYAYTLEEIYALEHELKRAIARHSELLEASTQLQIEADQIIRQAKHSRFRSVFSFDDFLEKMVERDSMQGLAGFVYPLFDMNIHKTLNLFQLDDMLDYKPEELETGEKTGAGKEQMYTYDDEEGEVRIQTNFDSFLKILFEELLRRQSFDLKFLHHMYEMKYTDAVWKNGDYYAFIVHLSQKAEYDLSVIRKNQDTFLEGIMEKYLKKHDGHEFDHLKFSLEFLPEDKIKVNEAFEISNIQFSLIGEGK